MPKALPRADCLFDVLLVTFYFLYRTCGGNLIFDFNMQEYIKSLGRKTDGELRQLVDQNGLTVKPKLAGDLLAAVKEEISDRTRLGIDFDCGGLSHRV